MITSDCFTCQHHPNLFNLHYLSRKKKQDQDMKVTSRYEQELYNSCGGTAVLGTFYASR